MTIRNFSDMMQSARELGPVPVAVAAADDPEVLASLVEGQKEGIISAHLVGDQAAIEGIAAREGYDLAGMAIIHQPSHTLAARQVVSLVREGQAAIVVKGLLKTTELLGPVLDRDEGLRASNLLTHVALFEIEGRDQLLYISDSGVVLYPTWEQKLDIIRNVVDVAHKFGLVQPRVAILGATDRVSAKTGLGVEALTLSKMAKQGWVEDAVVEGPLPVDVAVNPRAAQVKGIETAMPGTADILICSNVESGNIMAKSLQQFVGARMAGMVTGARAPIIINSRADNAETRLLSLAMTVVWAGYRSA
jgi:phosphate butyryltransferase